MRDASGNVKFDSIADLTDGSTVINQQETDYAQMTGEHKVVSVGTGSEDEYDGKDVKDRLRSSSVAQSPSRKRPTMPKHMVPSASSSTTTSEPI